MTATAEVWHLVFGGSAEEGDHARASDRLPQPRADADVPRLESVGATDAELVHSIRAGDESAFRAMYLAHASVLIGVARHILGTASDAEDVVQDVFADVWARRTDFAPRRVAAYLVGAVRRSALTRLRHRRVMNQTEASHADDVTDAVSSAPVAPDRIVSRAELAAALAEAVHRLPERRRTALLLRTIHGESYRDIAQVLGIGETAAHMLVTRTLASLRPLFERFLDER